MNYGLYIAASGMSAQMARQDVLSNNLANVSTTAFKPDTLAIRARDTARVEDRLATLPSNLLLERLGAGVMPFQTRVSLSAAPLERTGSPLDLGIDGEGYLLVRVGAGDAGVRLTRDGRLAVSAEGRLVTASDGSPVLDSSNQPITVRADRALIVHPNGVIEQDGSEVATLGFVGVDDSRVLAKDGSGLLRVAGGAGLPVRRATGRIMQEHLESSGTDAVKSMMAVTSASRAVDSNSTIIGYINEMMGRAIGTLGRVA